jgi:hypothetical protein
MSRPATKSAESLRAFTVVILPEGSETFGLELTESLGDDGERPSLKLRVNAARTRRVMASVLGAARSSGHPKWALGSHRRAPLFLAEEAGVRLALVLLTTEPLLKSRRVDAIAQAVAGMGTEETYYWYAQCVGPEGPRAQRALRLLLAEE